MAEQLHRRFNGAPCQTKHLVAPLRVVERASTAPPGSGDALIDRLRRRISARPGGRHDLPALARAAGLSASQLHRRSRAATGATPGAWRDRCRIGLAQALLIDTDLTVAAIARRRGLGDPSSLWQLFRRAGLPTPACWRTQQRGDRPA